MSHRAFLPPAALVVFTAVVVFAGCTEYKPFDSTGYLQGEITSRLGADGAAVEVPFAPSVQ